MHCAICNSLQCLHTDRDIINHILTRLEWLIDTRTPAPFTDERQEEIENANVHLASQLQIVEEENKRLVDCLARLQAEKFLGF